MELLDGYITDNFKFSEMQSNDNSPLFLNKDIIQFANMLQEFRMWYNRYIISNSWERSVEWNNKINGSPNSQHLNGIAIDFPYPFEYWSMSVWRKREFILNCRNKWKEINIKYGTTGAFYYYDRHIHIDSRTSDYFKYGYLEYKVVE